jgi:2-octaprenyl-3-methyl-6-methoxy-1,4-benzoquinol hydroxylase
VYDVVIAGGGMIGSAMALGLAEQGKTIALIEPAMPTEFDPISEPDIRVSAISQGSVSLLSRLGVWDKVTGMRSCPVNRLSVWEKPECRTDFSSQDIETDALCYIVENRVVQLALHQGLLESDAAESGTGRVEWYSGVAIETLQQGDRINVTLSDGQQITGDWLIGADGGQSQVRQLSGIGTQGWQYSQQALAIKVKMADQYYETWQQFSPTGPKAFLPLADQYACLVWYHQQPEIARLKGLSEQALAKQIQTHFPAELDDFTLLSCASFPLIRMHAQHYFKQRVILLGDAAHTINPLAGQGVNLGFKDVGALLQAFDCEQAELLPERFGQYEAKRKRENLLMMSVMDALYVGFSNDKLPLKLARNLGLFVADHAGWLKRQVMRYAMGIS